MPDYSNDVIKHTSGAVVYSLKRTLKCDICKDALISGSIQGARSRLSLLKNKGRLQLPLDDVVTICRSAEKTIKFNKNLIENMDKDVLRKLIIATLNVIPTSAFT